MCIPDQSPGLGTLVLFVSEIAAQPAAQALGFPNVEDFLPSTEEAVYAGRLWNVYCQDIELFMGHGANLSATRITSF